MIRHYLDHASTSPPRPEAVEAMLRWLGPGGAGDPARVHTEGRAARFALEEAREQVAELLGARPRQVVFTSGATEAVNAAVWGASRARPGGAMVSSRAEHSSVRESSERAASTVVELPVDSLGRVQVGALDDAIEAAGGADSVALVNCQLGNHEVATLQPAREVAHRCRELGVLCHVDAAMAAGHVAIDVEDLGADLVSVSSHKMGGPKGAGALVVRRGLRIEPLLVGGEQERRRRGGIEDLPAISGFGAVARTLEPARLVEEGAAARARTSRVLDLAYCLGDVSIYGDPADRLPHIACIGVHGVEAEAVLLSLDQMGIAAHSGSACSSEALAPSPVLEAMGVDADRSLRISVGWSTTEEDISALLEALPRALDSLRSLRE
jgi:cysteine desulfurase